MDIRICTACGKSFQPKAMGYNARYCSYNCKCRIKRKRLREEKPEQVIDSRRRSYEQTKKYPERYEKHLISGKKSRNKVQDWLNEYKTSIGCIDCGYNEYPAALQLDHEGNKSIEIADAKSSIARLKSEIEAGNCKVRCANCHSIRTWERKNGIL